jgi:hypothetical protein
MGIATPQIDNSFLDKVIDSIAANDDAREIVSGLELLPDATKQRLIGEDRQAAREAAREFIETYFSPAPESQEAEWVK